jgi:Protein of unknown function (DUF2490)
MRSPNLKSVILSGFILSTVHLAAQDLPSQQQIWPEVEGYYRINERFRVYSLVSGTKTNSQYTDGTAGIYMDFFSKPWIRGKLNATDLGHSSTAYYLWFRVGYSYSAAPPNDKKQDVNTLETETNNTYHLPAEIVLQTRNRLDWRWVNGNFLPIYRPRLKFVRNLKTEYLTFNAYIWSEYFFYLNDNIQNRFRLAIGTQIKILKFMDFEIYYLHQFQNSPSVPILNAMGVQFDFYFQSKHYEHQK